MKRIALMLMVAITFYACKNEKVEKVDTGDIEKELQTKLINAKEGDVIEIPEGRFSFTRSLSLNDVPNVTIKGAGMDKTFLSFKGQIDGAEGIRIKADGITVEGFTIEDSKGDAIKIQDSKNVVMRAINATWTEGAKETNGAYGLYPVNCENVLMENCEASYSSDAGIYIGQSRNVLMRNNLAHHNVAGIEIENCRVVEAYDNIAENNTGGFLIFDMPGLPQANGYSVKVHNNIVRENNFKNFSPEGGMVNIIPPGTGMLVVAHNDVEIYNNTIEDYKTLGLAVVTFNFTQRPFETDNGFNPYYSKLNIYDNTFKRKGGIAGVPDITKEFGKLINGMFPAKTQDIFIDGILNPELAQENGNYTGDDKVCIRNNGEDLRFVNLNAEGAKDLADVKKSFDRDMSKFDCSIPPIDTESTKENLALNKK
ncbi:MAG: parallel beta-helix domain-containing protein [Chitinophagales bacterium]